MVNSKFFKEVDEILEIGFIGMVGVAGLLEGIALPILAVESFYNQYALLAEIPYTAESMAVLSQVGNGLTVTAGEIANQSSILALKLGEAALVTNLFSQGLNSVLPRAKLIRETRAGERSVGRAKIVSATFGYFDQEPSFSGWSEPINPRCFVSSTYSKVVRHNGLTHNNYEVPWCMEINTVTNYTTDSDWNGDPITSNYEYRVNLTDINTTGHNVVFVGSIPVLVKVSRGGS